MKKSLFLILSLFIKINSSIGQITKAELIANGLTCSMCSNATYNQLKTLTFIDSITTDVEHTKFILHLKQYEIPNFKLIKSKVEDAGFSVGSLFIYMEFDNLEVENNLHHMIGDVCFHFMDTKKQILNKTVRLQLIDKGFIEDQEYKKYLKIAADYPCYKTGKMQNIQTLYHLKVAE